MSASRRSKYRRAWAASRLCARMNTIATERPSRDAGNDPLGRSRTTEDSVTRHGAPEQQRQRRIAWHRVIFLRGGKREEDQDEAGPAECQQARLSRARIDRAVTQLERCRARNTLHGKQPEQVKQPELDARDGIVVARIAQIQEPQHVLVDEVEPEKAVILARDRTACPSRNRADS